MIGSVATLATLPFAIGFGILAGYYKGWVDDAIQYLYTTLSSIPSVLLIAAFTRTFDQAAALGGGANVVLGALAGIMVPRNLMPAGMQTLSEWSPMGWALDGMQTVFLGAPDAAQVLPKVMLLLAFAIVCLALSWHPIRHPAQRA